MNRSYLKTFAVLASLAIAGCAQHETVSIAGTAEPEHRDVHSLAVLPEAAAASEQAEAVQAQHSEAPATQPALPEGHPPIPQAQPALPAGHPPIPGAQGMGAGAKAADGQKPAGGMPGLPAGHPEIPGKTPALPEGHPPIPGAGGAAGKAPAGMGGMPGGMLGGMPKGRAGADAEIHDDGDPVMGSVTVRPVQSTAGAAAVAPGTDVVVEVFDHDKLAGKLETKLGDNGTIHVTGIPMGPHFRTTARVIYAGVPYEGSIPEFDGKSTDLEIEIPVYEATAERPDWSIAMRHMIVQPSQGKLHVMEVLAVQNPSDRAWTGAARADGKKAALSLPLPAGAADLSLVEGFDDCCSIIENSSVTETKALKPGMTRYRLAYTLPIESGSSTLTTAMPVAVKAMMMIVPTTELTLNADGIGAPEALNMGGRESMLLKDQNLHAGHEIKLVVSDIPASAMIAAPAASAPAAAVAFDPSQIGRAIGGIGAVLVVVLGLSFVLLKPKGKKSA